MLFEAAWLLPVVLPFLHRSPTLPFFSSLRFLARPAHREMGMDARQRKGGDPRTLGWLRKRPGGDPVAGVPPSPLPPLTSPNLPLTPLFLTSPPNLGRLLPS